ncbi:hypothetical protein ABZX95_02115 [Streptomyces sp. NPDC004232]|uniref:hypothetical protein n=1 Tax=Streptomyces sp. NPDC004232 TaxID=3154454 RepID=UPI0033A47466
MRFPEWLTRPFADVAALARDLIASPREVLLVRAHHRWVGALYLAVLSVPAVFGYRPGLILAVVVLVIGGFSLGLDLLGMVAHVAWHRGRIWQSIACPLCDDGDDGPDDDPDDPDVPDDPYGLTLADHAWLHTISAKAPTAV